MAKNKNNNLKQITLRRLIGIAIVIPFIMIFFIIYARYSKSYSQQLPQTYSMTLSEGINPNNTENSIPLMWGEANNNNQYYVLMRDGQYFTKFDSNVNYYLDTDLIPNASYSYQIYSENSQGQILSKSNILTLTPENSIYNAVVIKSHNNYKVYSAFGDSITQGYETTDSYFERISNYLKNKEGTISYNEGIGGNTTYDLLSRINGELQQENPDLVTVMIGANDIRWGTINNPTVTSLDYKNNLIQILNDIDPSPQRTVFIFTLSPITGWNAPGFTAGSAQRLTEFNKIIEGIANKFGIPYISLDGMYTMKGILNKDGLHPNNIGDKYIYEQLKKEINLYN